MENVKWNGLCYVSPKAANKPEGAGGGGLITIRQSSSVWVQLFIENTTNFRIFKRRNTGSTTGTWMET